MKNTWKKVKVTVMAFALLAGAVAVPSQDAQAADHNLMVGKKIRIGGDTGGTKVVKGKKNIKIVKKSTKQIVIKGIKKGITKIQVGSGKEKFTYTVEVFPKVQTLTYNGKNASKIRKGAYNADEAGGKTKIVVKKGVKNIQNMAFRSCYGVTSISIPDSVTSIGKYAFDNCRTLKSLKIPDSVTSIGKGAFYCCYSLKSITIPNGVTSIADQTFTGCTSLLAVTLPDSVKSIEGTAFKNCTKLQSINIPDGVESISSSAFLRCSNLKSIQWKGTTYTSLSTFKTAFKTAFNAVDTNEQQ